MKKYQVRFAVPVWIAMTIDAEDEESAVDEAYSFHLTQYAGNGGTDKLVGTYDERVSVDVGCDSYALEGQESFCISVDELEKE